MKRIKTFLCFIMTAILFTSCGSEGKEHSGQNENIASNKDASSEERIQKKLSVTKDFGGFVMSVESDSDTYKTGETFVLTVSITNNTGKSVYINRHDECVLSGVAQEGCCHLETFTLLEKGDKCLIDADRFNKGTNDFQSSGEFENGNTFVTNMNYIAGNIGHFELNGDMSKVTHRAVAQIGDIDGAGEQIVLAEPGIYHGTTKTTVYDEPDTLHSTTYNQYSLEFSIEITE